MPPPFSKVTSSPSMKMSSESSEKADRIRKSKTQQTGGSNTILPEECSKLPKTTPKTDVNRNYQVQKDCQSPDQACSNKSSQSLSSSKNRSVLVTPSLNRQSVKQSTVEPKLPNTYPVHPNTDLIYTLLGLPMPRVAVEDALDSAEQCPVMDRVGLTRQTSARTEEVGTTDDLLQKFQMRMEVVRQVGQRGIVHSVEPEIKWIVLGEEEGQKWLGEVGIRTRQATRRILGWMGEGEEVLEKKHNEDIQMGVKLATVGTINASLGSKDCDSNFNENDWYVKKVEKADSREDGEVSDEDWYRKPEPTSSVVSADSSYFNTLGKMTRSTLNNLVSIGNLTITAVTANTTVVDEEEHAVECVKDEAEEVGTCPMCQKEMGMKVLIGHASYCEG